MLRKLIKNKKAQNTAEYAILISLVVAGIIAMQTYAQRALQGRIRAASQTMSTVTATAGGSGMAMAGDQQYEPYYLESSYTITKDDDSTRRMTNITDDRSTISNRTRGDGGYQSSSYDSTMAEVGGGV